MKSLKQFFQKQFSNLKEWFVESNRWVHIMAGWAVFIIMAFAIGLPMDLALNTASLFIGSYVASLIAMVMLEVKDKAWGGKFDWKDINAGMLFPNCMLIYFIIISII